MRAARKRHVNGTMAAPDRHDDPGMSDRQVMRSIGGGESAKLAATRFGDFASKSVGGTRSYVLPPARALYDLATILPQRGRP